MNNQTTNQNITQIVKEKIANICGIDIEKIKEESFLKYDLEFDSLDMVELEMNIEEEFDIKLYKENSPKDITVKELIDEVIRLIDVKNGKYQASGEDYLPIKEEQEKLEKFNNSRVHEQVQEKKAWYTFPLTFWELVEKLNWKENCRKDNCTKKLREKFYQLCEGNTYVMDYFNKYRNSLRHVLQCVLNEYELKTYGDRCASEFFKYGDDSWNDMANHIIGMGKETYFAILNDPKLASEYTEDFVESFAYCFHYDVK